MIHCWLSIPITMVGPKEVRFRQVSLYICMHNNNAVYNNSIRTSKNSLTPPLFLSACTNLCQVRKVSGHVFVCKGYRFFIFLWFFYCILELFRQCGIVCFLFFVFCFLFYFFISILDWWTVLTVWYFLFFSVPFLY